MKKINRLKVVLVEQRKTGKWLAEQLGKDPSTISKWCSNTTQPPLDMLVNIATLLNVDIKELINEKNIKDNIPRNTTPLVPSLDVLLDVFYKETDNTDIPLSQYNFRVTVEGKNQNGLFKSSWHLDYDNNNVQDFIHPHFHITWGGNKMKDLNLGEVLLLPTPRFSYPPMDIVLGVDFILSNFVKVDIYKQIQSDSQYKAAVKNAQEKYWKPYILSLAHHWCGNSCQKIQLTNIKAKHFHPTLID